MARRLWVIEVRFPERDLWTSTIGLYLTRDEARDGLLDWQRRAGTGASLRIVKYTTDPGAEEENDG